MGPTNRRLRITMPALPRPDSVALRGPQNVSPCSGQADLRCRQTDSLARSRLFPKQRRMCRRVSRACPSDTANFRYLYNNCQRRKKFKDKNKKFAISFTARTRRSPAPRSRLKSPRSALGAARTMVVKPPLPRSPSPPKWQRGGTGQSASALSPARLNSETTSRARSISVQRPLRCPSLVPEQILCMREETTLPFLRHEKYRSPGNASLACI